MKQVEFCELFKEEMGIGSGVIIGLDTELSSLEEWDSMGYLVTITFIEEKFGKKLPLEVIKNTKKLKN